MAEEPKPKTVKRELLIEHLCKRNREFRFKRKEHSIIQDKPFQIGLKITNIDSKPFPGAKISNLQIESRENKGLYEPFEEEFSIKSLNPNESHEVWVSNSISTYLSGLVWISCKVTPLDANDEITTRQIDSRTGIMRKLPDINTWGTGAYILGNFEYGQSKTNSLIMILTVLTFLEGIFGLRNIALWILSLVGSILLFLGTLVTTAAH